MGTSCKKPSRANTTRAAEFVANVLVHIQSDMNVILKDPSVIPRLNASLLENQDSLVTSYEYDRTYHNVKLYLSSYKLRKAFGKPAEIIWRKLFVRLNKGGWSRIKHQAYDSCWVLNGDAERRFRFSKLRYMGAEGITPAQLLKALDDISEKVVAPTDYVAEDARQLGFKIIQGYDKCVMTRDRHRVVLCQSQGLRSEVKAHNLQVRQVMRDRQTNPPVRLVDL